MKKTNYSLFGQDCYLEQQFVLMSGHLECAGVETALKLTLPCRLVSTRVLLEMGWALGFPP